MTDIGPGEILTAACVLAGPILAVQAQKFVERSLERRRLREQIFQTLLATAGSRLAPDHVRALNMIEIGFTPRGWLDQLSFSSRKKYRAVIAAWRSYALNLFKDVTNFDQSRHDVHGAEQLRLFRELLYSMSDALSYGITKDIVERGGYYPQGNVDLETLQKQLLASVTKVFSGEASLPMEVKSFPVSDEALKAQFGLNSALMEVLRDGVVSVEIKKDDRAIQGSHKV